MHTSTVTLAACLQNACIGHCLHPGSRQHTKYGTSGHAQSSTLRLRTFQIIAALLKVGQMLAVESGPSASSRQHAGPEAKRNGQPKLP